MCVAMWIYEFALGELLLAKLLRRGHKRREIPCSEDSDDPSDGTAPAPKGVTWARLCKTESKHA